MRIIMHDGSLGPRAVPDGRGGVVIAAVGEPFDVTDEVAGSAPSEWETCPTGDAFDPETGEDVTAGWAYDPLPEPIEVDGVWHAWRRRHLGHGLLAQEDVYSAAGGEEL